MITHFNPNRRLILVSARIEGPLGFLYAIMVLDTGAARTLVDPKLLMSVGYNPNVSSQQIRVSTASGVVVAPLVVVNTVESLGLQHTGLSVLAHKLPPSVAADSLLGLDFLRGTNLNIDFPNGRITLT